MGTTSSNKRDYALPKTPVRRIPTNRRSITGFVSFRGESSIQFESTLERDFVLLQEFSLPVLDVVSQPCEIPFVDRNGRSYIYIPDFLVQYRTDSRDPNEQFKPLLVEVKPETQWRQHWRKWMPKWKAARRFARENGWHFTIMDESRIRSVALQNITFLRSFVNLDFDENFSRQLLADVESMGSATFEYLLVKHFHGFYMAEGVRHLWHLLAARRLECDITLPLNSNTELWVPHAI